MAKARAARPKRKLEPTPSPDDIERELETVRERLRAEGAVRLSSFKPKGLRDNLVARLAAEGYELTGTWVRKPMREQIREALAHGALVTKKALTSIVRGVGGPELTRAVTELEANGELYRVLRGKSEAFTGAGAQVLEPGSLRALRLVVARLHEELGAVSKKKGATLLASDIEEALDEAHVILDRDASDGGNGAASPKPPDVGGRATVLGALDATRDERTGLSFVPQLVQRLLPNLPVALAHEVLLTAAREEVIELRPEGGLGRLTSDELQLCPPGPGGTRLSWARRLGGVS